MNFPYIFKQLGLLLLVLSAVLVAISLLFFLGVALLERFGDPDKQDIDPAAARALLFTGVIGFGLGGGLWRLTRRSNPTLGRREALLLVALTWAIGAAFSALPYWFWAPDGHPFESFINCYFESMSGLTTTGATVLADIEAVPRSLLLWRAFTQWIGGLGIVVLFVAVLPTLGVGGKRLFQVEAPGPAPEGLQPQIRHTARVLLRIYAAMTGLLIVLLLICGMTFFDAVCHTFTTIATAGFSTRTASIGAYDSTSINIVITIFMILSGVNFGLYYALLRRRFEVVLRDPELRTYLIVLTAGTTIVFAALIGRPLVLTTGQTTEPSTTQALVQATFQTAAIGTTTGYSTSDFNAWPFAAQAVLVTMMFIGGSAGSTAGGIKAIRIWVAFKVMVSEIEHVFRPNVVRPVRVGRTVLDEELKLGTLSYVLGIIVLFAVGAFLVMMIEQFNGDTTCDFKTAASASLACLCTIGPGLGKVGAIENYGWMTGASKMLLSLLMALGRLELFAIVVLLTPRFWTGD